MAGTLQKTNVSLDTRICYSEGIKESAPVAQ